MTSELEILLLVPFDHLIYYPNDVDDTFFESPWFRKIRELLEIEIDVVAWANECHEILQGNRKLQTISMFYSADKQSYILLDNYFDPYDQLDHIYLGLKTMPGKGETLRLYARAFSDGCDYVPLYSEGTGVVFRYYPIDEKTQGRVIGTINSERLKEKTIRIR